MSDKEYESFLENFKGMLDVWSICKKEYIFMQYTWLKDKTGKEIYEGDICERQQASWGMLESQRNHAKYICKIDWFMNWWSCRVNDEHCWFTFAGSHMKVIGNIYQNPDLLKK
jgi:uncharacterized phage protein (TIGR01671 family)